ncbi:spermidine resistance protein [Entophlyctis luteolus]|nr:spermidine resistance protein [Entophlyctis luteolus]
MEVDVKTQVVLPGDVIPDIIQGTRKVTVGPGLHHDAERGIVAAAKGGLLQTIASANETRVWVECNQRRYVPVLNEPVIGIVTQRGAEHYRVDVGSAHPAALGVLAFEGATKRNRPNLEVGDLIYARVSLANKDMEPEVECINPTTNKADGYGEIKGGFMFKCSLGLSRRLFDPDNAVLQQLGTLCAFEVAAGMNGRVWVKADTVARTIALTQALQGSEGVERRQAKEYARGFRDALAGAGPIIYMRSEQSESQSDSSSSSSFNQSAVDLLSSLTKPKCADITFTEPLYIQFSKYLFFCITMVQTALPKICHPYNHHIYSSTQSSDEKLTLSGFEGPEKLLEIWFRPNPNYKYGPNGESLRPTSPVSSLNDSVHSSFSEQCSPCLTADSDDSCSDNEHRSASQETERSALPEKSGLRIVPRPVWEEMLDIVKCKVLSTLHNAHADAYLLSESSMFVYSNKLVLKTCGTTTLLNAIPRIMEIARDYCGIFDVDALFYSRKAFLFPEKQIYPHGKWGDEVAYLDGLFPDASYETSGYVVGKVNGDHWCLYTATPHVKILNEDGDEMSVRSASTGGTEGDTYNGGYDSSDDNVVPEDEVTLEIMMQDLDPNVTKMFWRTPEEAEEARKREETESMNGKPDSRNPVFMARQPNGFDEVRRAERRLLAETGIQDVYPTSIVDDFLFDPCGYSLNGLFGQYYWTIHVTPEDICSYASFETTIPVRKFHRVPSSESLDGFGAKSDAFLNGSASEHNSYEEVIADVLNCFKPGKFSVTLFSRKSHSKRHGRHGLGLMDDNKIDGFRRSDRIMHAIGDWDMLFAHYVKDGKKKPAF